MQVEREASMPVTLADVPSGHRQRRVPAKLMDMIPTSLRGLPHLRLKPGLPVPPHRGDSAASAVPSCAAIATSSLPGPHLTLEDEPDDHMEDVHPRPPSPPSWVPALAPAPAPQQTCPPIDTPPNRFGVFRRYTTAPRSDPEEGLTLDAFADAGTHLRTPPDPRERNPL